MLTKVRLDALRIQVQAGEHYYPPREILRLLDAIEAMLPFVEAWARRAKGPEGPGCLYCVESGLCLAHKARRLLGE